MRSRRTAFFCVFTFVYLFDRIVGMKNDALDVTKPDEYLYGRAGYLYSLMFLREQIRSDIIDAQLVTDVNSL